MKKLVFEYSNTKTDSNLYNNLLKECDKVYKLYNYKITALCENAKLENSKTIKDYKKIELLENLIKKNHYKFKMEVLNLIFDFNDKVKQY